MIIKRNNDLLRYLDSTIRPKYRTHDGAHNKQHLNEILGMALELSKVYEISAPYLYVCSYYHNLGLDGEREEHEKRSADYLRCDKNLLRWFEVDEIEE